MSNDKKFSWRIIIRYSAKGEFFDSIFCHFWDNVAICYRMILFLYGPQSARRDVESSAMMIIVISL